MATEQVSEEEFLPGFGFNISNQSWNTIYKL
jgi:hypothetical protein